MKELQKRIGEYNQEIGELISKKTFSRKRMQKANETNDSIAWEKEWDIQHSLNKKIEKLEKETRVLEQALAILVGVDNWEDIR